MTATTTNDVGTQDQADTIDYLTRIGAQPDVNVEIDAYEMPYDAIDPCGCGCGQWGTVHIPNVADALAPGCAVRVIRWYPGETVSVEVARLP